MQNPKRATAVKSHAAYPRISPTPWSHSTPPQPPVEELIETRHMPGPDEDVIFGPTLVGRLPDLPMTSLRTVLELCDTRKSSEVSMTSPKDSVISILFSQSTTTSALC